MVSPAASNDWRGCDAVETVNPDGTGAFVLVCEHASNAIPDGLARLGLSQGDLESHIAWDPGARDVARHLSEYLDSPLVATRLSRLIYDCNRPPNAESAIPARSESVDIPGNTNIGAEERLARTAAVYSPFRNQLADTLDRALAQGCMPIVLTVHSFTPVYLGTRRELDIGVLHDTDSRFADAFLQAAGADIDGRQLRVRRNEPYGPKDGVTHTLALHAMPRGLPNVMIEIRNELLVDAAARRDMAAILGRVAVAAAGQISERAAMDKAG